VTGGGGGWELTRYEKEKVYSQRGPVKELTSRIGVRKRWKLSSRIVEDTGTGYHEKVTKTQVFLLSPGTGKAATGRGKTKKGGGGGKGFVGAGSLEKRWGI